MCFLCVCVCVGSGGYSYDCIGGCGYDGIGGCAMVVLVIVVDGVGIGCGSVLSPFNSYISKVYFFKQCCNTPIGKKQQQQK